MGFINAHPEPLPGYKFKVYILGIAMGFSKITDIQKSAETEILQEGGVNDCVYSLSASVKNEKTMVFERGMADRGILLSVVQEIFAVGHRLPMEIVIVVSGRNESTQQIFIVEGAFVKKWSSSDLNALSGDLIIERFEISYEKLTQLPFVAQIMGAIGL